MTIIGLAGPARSGKSTIAEHLRKSHGFAVVAFADPIRAALSKIFGFDSHDLEELKETDIPWLGKSPRYLMQTLGTEWGRELIHPDLWLRLVERKIDFLLSENDFPGVIIPDVRFDNEAAWVRQHGQLWHLKRLDAPAVHPHVSENGIQPYESEPVLINPGDLSDLQVLVDGLLLT